MRTRLFQKSLRFQVPREELRVHRDRRHKRVEKRLLPLGERGNRRELDHSDEQVMIQDRNKQHLPGSDAADARGNLKSFPFGRRDFQGSFFQSCLTDKSLPKSKRSGVGRAMQSECANAVDAQPRIVREIKGRIEQWDGLR